MGTDQFDLSCVNIVCDILKKLKRLDTPWGRAYVLGEEEPSFLPSVTTILSLVKSTKLKEIEDSIGKERLAEISEKAALRGTAMHKFLENYVICLRNGGDTEKCLLYTQRKSTDELLNEIDKPLVDIGRSLFYNIYHERKFDNVKKILLSEGFLYSEKYLFAGTTDYAYLDKDNKVSIVDFKSASGPRDEETVSKYELQGGAYSIAFEEIYKKKVSRIEIWISYSDGVQNVIVEGERLEQKKKEFIYYCQKYHEMWESDKIRNFYFEQQKK